MKKLAILAMASLISVTASASNWVLVAQNVKGDKVYVDADSISVSGYIRSAFIKRTFSEIQVSSNDRYNSETIFQQANCASQPKQLRYLSAVAELDGQYAFHHQFTRPYWSIVYPDSVGEAQANFMCAY